MNNQIVIPLHTRSDSRYKAEVRDFTPATERENLEQFTSCFVGISLENPNFIGNKLDSMIHWISKRFPHCVFLLGDQVHRLTLQIRKGLDDENSIHHALGLGDYYLRTHQHFFKHSLTGENLPIIRGSDIYQQAKVVNYREQLKTLFDTNNIFRSAVEHFAQAFILRGEEMDANDAACGNHINWSCHYVLEELAETCYMISQGHRVLVYPGSLAIFQQIADDGFENMPAELNELVNISLRLKRRGKKRLDTALSASV